MTETYDEGIEFASRPMALNGFYKYLPGSTAPLSADLSEWK